MDPYGLALENFDAIGKYRSTYPNGSAIDASTSIGNATFSGLSGLNDFVSQNPLLLECVEQKLFTYGLGRAIQGTTDQPYLDQIQATWTSDKPSLRRLIKLLVLADTFRQRHG